MSKSIRGLKFTPTTDPAQRDAILEVLGGLALSDHLGDVRDEETTLWRLIGVEHPETDSDNAYRNYVRTCKKNGLPLPHDDDDDEQEGE